jgi:hypothetical protein
MAHMEELVSSMRSIQKVEVPPEVARKDAFYTPIGAAHLQKLTQMDAILFRKERSKLGVRDPRDSVKYPHSVSGEVVRTHRDGGRVSGFSRPPPLPPPSAQPHEPYEDYHSARSRESKGNHRDPYANYSNYSGEGPVPVPTMSVPAAVPAVLYPPAYTYGSSVFTNSNYGGAEMYAQSAMYSAAAVMGVNPYAAAMPSTMMRGAMPPVFVAPPPPLPSPPKRPSSPVRPPSPSSSAKKSRTY